jgi:peptide/nickel transport system substrate-binding protein
MIKTSSFWILLLLGVLFAQDDLRKKIPPAPQASPFVIPKAPFALPSWEELEKMEWEAGWVANWKDLAAQRAKEIKTDKTAEWAVSQRNDPQEGQKMSLTEEMKKKYLEMVAALSQPPQSDEEVDWSAEFKRHIVAPKVMNPILTSSAYENYLTEAFSGAPMAFDHRLVALADDAYVKEWRKHKEGLYDILILRDDVVWEDGKPWTAFDVEFSYHMIMKESISVPAVRNGTEDLKWVKAYDKEKIVFFHKESLATNPWNINFPILPQHIYERSIMEDETMVDSAWHNYWNQYPLSSGPYKVIEKTSSHVLMERRDDFYQTAQGKLLRPKPYMKYIRFKIIDDDNVALLELKSGNIDELQLRANQFMRQTNDDDFYKYNTKVYGPTWTYMYICWQQKGVPGNPFFADVRVRRAMAYAFNLERWLNDINFGLYQQGAGTFHPDSPYGSPQMELIQRDMDEAQYLLQEAGWTGDANQNGIIDKEINGQLVDFEFTLTCPTSGTAGDCAVILQQDLKQLGIKMDIQKLEWATYQSRVYEKKFQACCAAWGAGADPDTSRNLWTTGAYADGRNYGGYSNEEVDELFDQGRKEFHVQKRQEIYQKINEKVYEEQPYLFLNHRSELWAFNRSLRGYNFSPRDPFGYFMGFSAIWKVKEK